MADGNQNRPPRANQFSLGIQREITPSFVMEAAYVGNRVAWLAGPLGSLSQISPQQYAAYGLFPYPGTGPCSSGGGVCASTTYNNNNDRVLLSTPISSTAVIQNEAAHGITNLLPYSGFPKSSTLQSVLYAFPQFGALLPTGSATGNSKYDSLQMKATKRFSHGLQASGAFTFAKGFTRANRQDFFNPESAVWALQQIPPRALTFNFVYTTPKASFLNKIENAIIADWQIGGYALYQSGAYLAPPAQPHGEFPAQRGHTGSGPAFVQCRHQQYPQLQSGYPTGAESARVGALSRQHNVRIDGRRHRYSYSDELLQRFPRPTHSDGERELRPQLPDQGKDELPDSSRVRQHL